MKSNAHPLERRSLDVALVWHVEPLDLPFRLTLCAALRVAYGHLRELHPHGFFLGRWLAQIVGPRNERGSGRERAVHAVAVLGLDVKRDAIGAIGVASE